MGIFDKLLGKKKEAEIETGTVKDGSTIIIGGNSEKTAREFRARRVRNILTPGLYTAINDLAWPEGGVNSLVVCFNLSIPIGVINYDKWFGQVLGSAGLNRFGKDPEMNINCVPAEKVGMILLHWNSVDKHTCFSILEKLQKAVQEWS